MKMSDSIWSMEDIVIFIGNFLIWVSNYISNIFSKKHTNVEDGPTEFEAY